jgi:hypothetical protein
MQIDPNIPAATKYGSAATIAAKITPEMFSECQAWVQSGRWGYKTNSALVRNALHNHLRFLADAEPGVVNIDATDILLELTRSEARSEQWFRVVGDTVKQVEGHLANGRVNDATRIWQKAWAVVVEIPPGEMRTQGEAKLQQFEFLRPATGPMSLRPSEAS